MGLKEALEVLEREYVSPEDQAARARSRLIREGEELEAEEKTIGFWSSIKAHKMILVYSTTTSVHHPL